MTKAAMSWVSSRPPWQRRRRPSQKRLHQTAKNRKPPRQKRKPPREKKGKQTAKKRKPPRQKKGKPQERHDVQLLRLPNDLQLLRLPSDRQLPAASSISRVGLQTILTKTRQQRNRYEGTSKLHHRAFNAAKRAGLSDHDAADVRSRISARAKTLYDSVHKRGG